MNTVTFTKPIIFYDGICGLCDRFVQFLVARGGSRRYLFAPLQGTTAARMLSTSDRSRMDTILLLEPSGSLSQRSTAAIKILAGLGGVWHLFVVLLWIPRPVRDFFYDRVAERRYKIFGRLGQCRIPSSEEREAFLD